MACVACGQQAARELAPPGDPLLERPPAGAADPGGEPAAAVDGLLAPLVESDYLSGALVVARGGKLLFAGGFGLADREHGAVNSELTPFRLASVSKSITAVAVLQLVEKGALDLDARLESYLPGFDHGELITIEHLLGHRSGIPSDVYLADFGAKSRQSMTLDEAVEWLRAEAQPRFLPGERFEYSNSGYVLLSSIIEQVSGTPFEKYLFENVFGPAGMSDSGLGSAERILPRRARGYSRTEAGSVANAAYRDPAFGWGAGGLYSTARDLLSFDRALRGDRLLSSETRRVMWTPRSETPWGNHYGLGWFIEEHQGREIAVALGSTGGFVATLRHFLADDVAVAVLLNHDFLLYEELFDEVSSIALDLPWKPLLQRAPSRELTRLSGLAGVYEMDDGTLLELRATEGDLEFGPDGAENLFTVYPTAEDRAYVPAQNSRLRFRTTETGEVELLALFGNLAWRGRCIRGGCAEDRPAVDLTIPQAVR